MVPALVQAGFDDLGDTYLVLRLSGRVLVISEKVRGFTENPGERSEVARECFDTARQFSEAVQEGSDAL